MNGHFGLPVELIDRIPVGARRLVAEIAHAVPSLSVPDRSLRVPYQLARAHAAEHRWREKVLAYVTRQPDELLVFSHTEEYPDAGIQVPAGGVEPGEEPIDAVLRETREESGLELTNPIYLGSIEWLVDAPSRIRHFYWLQAPLSTPDRWEHRVSSSGVDHGMIFRYAFVPRSDHGLLTGHGFRSGLDDLDRAIAAG
jgi:8-oxo-dGTP diphosphatase